MDDEDFEDLLAGVDLLEDSSQESLTNAAANLFVGEDGIYEYRGVCTSRAPIAIEAFKDLEVCGVNLIHDGVHETPTLTSAPTPAIDTEALSFQPSRTSGYADCL